MAFFSVLDAVVSVGAIVCWFMVASPTDGLSASALAGIATPAWLLAALAVSGSHVLYACVWYMPEKFSTACASPPLSLLGKSPVTVFAFLVALAKGLQQLGLLGFVAATYGNPFSAAMQASGSTWALAAVLICLGQTLNAAIYAAIGKDGVYYGFKLGAPVPWCDGFPFNLGFRHPQYVGGFCSQLGVVAVVSSPAALKAGLLPLGAWWFFLYSATSLMEASGDNDGKSSKTA
ncbi:hypothetical protein AB1Y20_003413 [Prymnesium parvum]|uniref:phosphatidyl-N-methylethanolamine N-methyltransferase n=1 Tax=Prymnesium parvum TaxID=97485 RepID=A0AB34JCZ0_PRYPA